VPSRYVSSPIPFPLVLTRSLSAGFKVLSEAERTATLYSLPQHSIQVQIRFYITALQQMARADPMTARLSGVLCRARWKLSLPV